MHAQRYKLVMVSDDGKRHLLSGYDPFRGEGMTFPEATAAYQYAVRDTAIAEGSGFPMLHYVSRCVRLTRFRAPAE